MKGLPKNRQNLVGNSGYLFILLALITAGTVLFSCAPRKVVQEEKAPAITQEQRLPEQKVAQPEKVTPERPEVISEKPVTVTERPLEVAKISPEAAKPKRVEFPDIYFDFDKYEIRDDAKPILNDLARWLKNNPKAGLIIEGHCDERGTNQYNLALGERRASAVKNYLMILGISSSRIETVSYGEERPLCTEQTEECWQLNRRAHFVIYE